jgi:hypothetical protein
MSSMLCSHFLKHHIFHLNTSVVPAGAFIELGNKVGITFVVQTTMHLVS